MITRLLKHLQWIRNARSIGVPFLRTSSFTLPKSMRLKGHTFDLAYPDEIGIWNDFLVCLIKDEYGLRDIRFPVKTIADIGGNVGFLSLAARAAFPAATIHTYEPNARTLTYLATNAASGGFQVYAEAVGATEGRVMIVDSGDSNQARTSAVEAGTGVPQVPLITVVERLGGWIDLAKFDCEGAEWEMFQNHAAWKRIGEVRMEYHLLGTHQFNELEQTFRELGFELHLHHSQGDFGTVWARNLSRAAI